MNRYARARAYDRQLAGPEVFGYELSPLESTLAGQVVTALRRIGCTVSSTMQWRRSRQTEGMYDLWCVHSARMTAAWIDIKTPSGRLSKDQEVWAIHQEAAGVWTFVARSPEDAVAQFVALRREAG